MSESTFIFDVDAGNFSDIVIQKSQQVPVLVDFWAEWCGPCQSLMPLLAKLAEEFQGKFILAKVNSDNNQELASQFGVRSLPTVMVFRHGEIVDQFMGALPEPEIRTLLAKHVARESDIMLEQALQTLAEGDIEGALQMMRDAATSDPDNFTIHKTYARVLIETGNPDDAAAVLKALPADVRMEEDVRALEASLEFIHVAQAHPDVKALQANIENDPADCESRYALAAHKLLHGDMDGAMEQLLEIMKRDRSFNDDAGHRGLLRVFELLGNEGELVSKYRKLMARVLF